MKLNERNIPIQINSILNNTKLPSKRQIRYRYIFNVNVLGNEKFD